MSNFKHKLNSSLGLEDEAPNVQVNIDTDDMGMPLDNVTSDGENTPEADEVEIIEESADIDAEDDVIEEMAEAADSLESIYIAMEAAQANGGMTPEAAAFASIAVENIVGRYGATSQDVGISLEAFGDNRAVATTVSMEGIKETLKALWETIVKKFQALVKKITDFFNKTIAAAPRLKRRAEGVKKAARSTSGSAKESKMKDGGLWRALNVNAGAVTAAGIINGLKVSGADFQRNVERDSLTKLVNDAFGKANLNDMSDRDGTGIATSIADTYYPGLKVISTGGDTFMARASTSGTVPSGFKPGGNDSFDTFGTLVNLPGNKMAWTGVFKGTVKRTTAISALRDVNVGIYTQNSSYKPDAKKEAEMELPVLSTTDVQGICDTVIANMDIIIKCKTQADKKLNGVKIMKAAGDKLIATLKDEDADGGGAKTRASELVNAVVEARRRKDVLEATQMRYNYSLSKSALAYCQRSLKQYKAD